MMRRQGVKVLCAGALCVVMGCATAKRVTWNDISRVVEPQPDVPHGSLKVFTKTSYDVTGEDSYYPHTPYTIYAEDGKKVKRIENHSSREDNDPETVELPPGKYVVVPQEGSKKDMVGVVIADQKLTEVHLPGGD